jgi:predicted site-specific integrase-resolvase
LSTKITELPKSTLRQTLLREKLLSRKELAQRWDCHIETLKRWEARGRLKPIKVGYKFLRYRLSDIEALERKSERAAH